MRTFFKELRLPTSKRVELIDITNEVERAVRESGIREGICLIFVPHATAALLANEHEGGLINDIVSKISEEYPKDGRWQHNLVDDNASAHLAASFIGASRVFPVKGGKLIRGTWQNIFLVELDGPRGARKVIIEIMGE